jgi:hypothetical protein
MSIGNAQHVLIVVDDKWNATGGYATRHECHKVLGTPHLAVIVNRVKALIEAARKEITKAKSMARDENVRKGVCQSRLAFHPLR